MRDRARLMIASAALGLCCLAVAGAMYVADRHASAPLSAVEVERLRMFAGAGRARDAFVTLHNAAIEGNLTAQRALGRVLLGRGHAADTAAGRAWLRRAAEHDDPEAAYLLGKSHLETVTDASDYRAARVWLSRAGEHPQSQYLLALIYRNGYGVLADNTLATDFLQRAAANGVADAMFLLGNAYLDGDGVERTPERAVAWYMRAASQEHPQATQALALAFRDGAIGLPRDETKYQQLMLEVSHAVQHLHN